MRDRRDIRARREQGGTIRGLARELGADRNTIRRALDPDARLEYSRPSISEEYEPAVRDVLADYPRMSVDQVSTLIEWPGSRRTLSDLVAKVRPLVLEREREGLKRPAVGKARTGRIRLGRLNAGHLTLGSIHGNQEHDPGGAA